MFKFCVNFSVFTLNLTSNYIICILSFGNVDDDDDSVDFFIVVRNIKYDIEVLIA